MEEKDCKRCGRVFTPRDRDQVYCSAECRTAPRACAGCGQEFTPGPKAGHQRFCSTACKAKASNARQRRAWLPLKNPNPEPRACAHCGEEFLPKRRDRIYCYDSWCVQAAYQAGSSRKVHSHTVACDGCGTEFVGKHPSARWCSKRCANRHWGLVRSRQRGQLSEARYTDLEIFERDAWRCHLCGKKVRRDLDRQHPDGATIDHLIPTALGGLDEPANVATAHWKCNRAKQTRAVGEQLALL